jgi:hypothetical protein
LAFPKSAIIDLPSARIKDKERKALEWTGTLIGTLAWFGAYFGTAQFVFRGHSVRSWGLRSSLWRSKHCRSKADLDAAEATILTDVSGDFWFQREFG